MSVCRSVFLSIEKELATVKEQLSNARQTSDTGKAGLVSSLELSKQQITDLETNYRDTNQNAPQPLKNKFVNLTS